MIRWWELPFEKEGDHFLLIPIVTGYVSIPLSALIGVWEVTALVRMFILHQPIGYIEIGCALGLAIGNFIATILLNTGPRLLRRWWCR